MTDVKEAWQLWPRATSLRLLVAGSLSFFLLLSFQQAGQLFVIDEAEFPFIAEATAQSGTPVYYHGELRPVDVGIFHPPLYVYLLGGWIQALGDSHVSVRAFGIVCQLLTSAFVVATIRLLFPRRADLLGSLGLLLYITNPFVIASGLLPDIDGTVGVLAVAAALYVLVAIALSDGPSTKEVILAGLVFGFALSTKLTTPLALAPLMLVAFVVSGRSVLIASRDYLLSIGLGMAGFLTWWGAMAGLSSAMRFSYPFEFTYDSLVNKSGTASLQDRLAAIVPHPMTLFWLDPVLIAVTGGVLVAAVYRWRNQRARAVAIVCSFALGTILAYDVITTPVFRFPKYWIAAVPAATVASIAALGWVLEYGRVTWRWRASPVILVAGLTVGASLTTIALQRAISESGDVAPVRELTPTLTVSWALAVLITIAISVRGKVIVQWAFPIVAASLAAVMVHSVALATIQRSADYSTRYYYGERGFARTVADVQALSLGGSPIMAPKDIGFESGLPFYEDALLLPDPAQLQDILESGAVELAVTRKNFDYSEPVFPDGFAVIRKHMEPVVDRPDSGFVVWRLK